MTHDLQDTRWRLQTNGWLGLPCYDGESFWGRDDPGDFIKIAADTGRVTVSQRMERGGLLRSFTDKTVVMQDAADPRKPRMLAFERGELTPLWESGWFGTVTSVDEKYLVEDEIATVLRCVDAQTGRVEWTFEVATAAEGAAYKAGQGRPNTIRQGFPSIVTLNDGRILLFLNDGDVCALELKTGALKWTPFSGPGRSLRCEAAPV
jgi:outer membrane protein assembly factor BamB